jgi:hypothetical protein
VWLPSLIVALILQQSTNNEITKAQEAQMSHLDVGTKVSLSLIMLVYNHHCSITVLHSIDDA